MGKHTDVQKFLQAVFPDWKTRAFFAQANFPKDLWTQTWITNDSSQPGGIKVKTLRAHAPESTTFQGEIEGKNGAVYYDRTILTALPGGRVHQEIQVSRDGTAWHTGFDAIYVPHGQQL